MRKATDQRDAQIISLLWTSLLPFHGGDVLCFEVKCFDGLDVCCGVRSCDGHAIWCNVMACVVSCHVMQSDVMVMSCTAPVLLRTTKYYSNTTPYYKYYSVLLCTTKYYSNTTLNYKVLLQYYSILQSTTPILLRTTNTTLYYKVLLQYYPVVHSTTQVLQSTTPVLPCTTKYYSVLQILLCTTPVLPSTTKYYSSTTLYYSSTTMYYKVLLQY